MNGQVNSGAKKTTLVIDGEGGGFRILLEIWGLWPWNAPLWHLWHSFAKRLSDSQPPMVYFVLGLFIQHGFAIKMPARMSEHWQHDGEADEKGQCADQQGAGDHEAPYGHGYGVFKNYS